MHIKQTDVADISFGKRKDSKFKPNFLGIANIDKELPSDPINSEKLTDNNESHEPTLLQLKRMQQE